MASCCHKREISRTNKDELCQGDVVRGQLVLLINVHHELERHVARQHQSGQQPYNEESLSLVCDLRARREEAGSREGAGRKGR